MPVQCRNCKEDFEIRGQLSVEVSYHDDVVLDLILTCPHCGSRYNTFIDVKEDLENWVQIGLEL